MRPFDFARHIAACETLDSQLEVARASDLHLTAGSPPMVRVRGRLRPLDGYPKLDADGHARDRLLDPHQRPAPAAGDRLADRLRLLGPRPRALPRQRLLPARRDRRGLPPDPRRHHVDRRRSACRRRSTSSRKKPRGFVLVTGPTGSGKSTTLAAMIDEINDDARGAHHDDRGPDRVPPRAQEVRSSTSASSAPTRRPSRAALKAALRQDPDVILVGEMRDLETISTALTAAETGHLVFATLHTQDAPQTIDRIIDVFPPHQQAAGPRAALGRAAGHHDPAAAADRRRLGARRAPARCSCRRRPCAT